VNQTHHISDKIICGYYKEYIYLPARPSDHECEIFWTKLSGRNSQRMLTLRNLRIAASYVVS